MQIVRVFRALLLDMYKIKKDIQIIFPEDVNIGLNPEPDDDSEVVLPSGDTIKLSTYKVS